MNLLDHIDLSKNTLSVTILTILMIGLKIIGTITIPWIVAFSPIIVLLLYFMYSMHSLARCFWNNVDEDQMKEISKEQEFLNLKTLYEKKQYIRS